ncbi:hypothetical protein Pla22_39210 [Rubripirellula amarantea]|uniref:DUF2271 domain-containing protein n=1 Tax=Rubripirellula amarantea TaxID=2527999 RepID=A0A5C5WK02_9BACT|nr:DUF2271 domain-containing protein [Rubripirellula amarantea]TWT51144.1 hypothetical protein Pla22_39210 [Rubripirellula amarantea]
MKTKNSTVVSTAISFAVSLITLVLLLTSVGNASEPSNAFTATIEIPKLNVSEYHRPYVAVWIQDENKKAVANLAVWYQRKASAEGAGTKWLPDLRQWWRRSGRSLEMPVDGVSGATRPAGTHTVTVALDDPRLADLVPGDYSLIVEAAREVGGREVIEIPFAWPVDQDETKNAEGNNELGTITLTIQPAN